jgi:hypothetical protein
MPGPLDKKSDKPLGAFASNNMPEWTFIYKDGIAPANQGCVYGDDEQQAVAVAKVVCETLGWRFIGSVRPRILGGPELLKPEAVLSR